MSVLNVELMDETAFAPIYDNKNGYLIFASEDTQIKPGLKNYVRTKIKISFPINYGMIICSYGVYETMTGLIDSDYRGEMGAHLITDREKIVKRGEPIAKLLLVEIEILDIIAE